jgi:hypothetical protein
MTNAKRDTFVEDWQACKHEKHLLSQGILLDATYRILTQKDLMDLLQTSADHKEADGYCSSQRAALNRRKP